MSLIMGIIEYKNLMLIRTNIAKWIFERKEFLNKIFFWKNKDENCDEIFVENVLEKWRSNFI